MVENWVRPSKERMAGEGNIVDRHVVLRGSMASRRFGNVILMHASMFHRILYVQGMPWHLEPHDWYRIG
jgi:hypothetical protein